MTAKILADGQLANAKGTLYTCPGATQGIIKTIKLVNTDSVSRTVNLYIKKNGSVSRRICPKDMIMGKGAMWEDPLALEIGAADIIEGDASVVTTIDYLILGVEKT